MPWAVFVSQNSEWTTFWFPFRSEWASFRNPRDRNFDRRGTLISISFLGLSHTFRRVTEHQNVSVGKTKKKITQWIDQKKMLFTCILFQEFASHQGKMHIEKMHISGNFGHPHFSLCFLPPAARSLKRTKKHREIEMRFLGPLVDFDVEERTKFWFRICITKQQVFPRVVGVCGECHRVGHVVINITPERHF